MTTLLQSDVYGKGDWGILINFRNLVKMTLWFLELWIPISFEIQASLLVTFLSVFLPELALHAVLFGLVSFFFHDLP